jgi:hypothetical protein
LRVAQGGDFAIDYAMFTDFVIAKKHRFSGAELRLYCFFIDRTAFKPLLGAVSVSSAPKMAKNRTLGSFSVRAKPRVTLGKLRLARALESCPSFQGGDFSTDYVMFTDFCNRPKTQIFLPERSRDFIVFSLTGQPLSRRLRAVSVSNAPKSGKNSDPGQVYLCARARSPGSPWAN